MYWQFTPYLVPLGMSAVITGILAVFVWTRRPAPGALLCALLMLALTEWTLASALELASADMSAAFFWTKVGYLGTVSAPVAWLATTLEYTGRQKWLTHRNLALLGILPLITLVLVWTNELHHLMWSDISYSMSGSFSVLQLDHGLWYWINTAYIYLLILTGFFLLVQMLRRSQSGHRTQPILLVIGALAPFVGHMLYILDLAPNNLDLTPFGLTISGLTITWSLFHFRPFDIVPVARDTAIGGMSDGMIVLNAKNRIVDINPAAQRFIGHTAAEVLGQPLMEVLADYPDLEERPLDMALAHKEVVRRQDGAQRYYELHLSPLYDPLGRLMSSVITVLDITERKQAEEVLRQSEERYRTILESVEDGYFEVDIAGNYVFVNDANCRLLGYSREELTGMSYRAVSPEEDAKKLYQDFNSVYRTGEPMKSISYRFTRKDGSVGFGELSVSVQRNREGEIIGFRGVSRDVTERRRMEEALRQAYDEVEAKVEERTTQLTRANEQLEREAAEREQAQEALRKARDELETRVTERTAELAAANRELWSEVTERKRAEEALKESEERYRTILDDMEDSYFEVDLAGSFTFVNDSACRQLGYSRKELTGMDYRTFSAEKDGKAVYKAFNSVYRTGKPVKGLFWGIVRRDGTTGFAEASVFPLRNQGGDIIGFRGVTRDVTGRTQMEQALRESEEKYRTLFATALEGVTIIDGQTLKVVLCNQSAATMFGFHSPEEAIGLDPLTMAHPDDLERTARIMLQDGFGKDLRETNEVRLIGRDGRELWTSIVGAVTQYEGRPVMMVSFRDITETRQAEKALRETEETYRAQLLQSEKLAAIGELVAGVAHEVNNPLMAVSGFSELLLEDVDDGSTREYLEIINKETDRAITIMRGLLSFARKHEPVKKYISINESLTSIVGLRVYELKLDNIEVVTKLDPDFPKTMADSQQLQQVFLNLITNAEQAMKEAHGKGRLVIETRAIDEMIQITFADDGPGISDENLARVFEPFFTTKDVGKGTGLGLSICYGIIRDHGGEIHVKSTEGEGTTFTIEIPVLSEMVATSP